MSSGMSTSLRRSMVRAGTSSIILFTLDPRVLTR